MTDENAHVKRHMTAARDIMSGQAARRQAALDLITAEQELRAQGAGGPPSEPLPEVTP
jgi:hypothetical protein